MAAMMKSRPGTVALLALTLTACAKRDNTASDTSVSRTAVTGADTPAASSTPVSGGGWSDANIFAILDAANVADSTEGAIAATKGTSAQVRDFGKQMMRDHHSMRVEAQALAKKLNVTAQLPTGDNSQAGLQKYTDLLNNTTKGKDFDKAYIDLQIEDHMAALEKATKAMAATQTAELKNLLQKATPKVQSHLDRAEAIEKSMR